MAPMATELLREMESDLMAGLEDFDFDTPATPMGLYDDVRANERQRDIPEAYLRLDMVFN